MIMALITALIWIILIGVIVWAAYYIADRVPLPDPFNRIVKLLALIVGLLVVVLIIVGLIQQLGVNLPAMP
jgi:multisubunit Na+/H+ antiporter MnhB subunit